jgi:hypothetical protein
MCCQCDSEYVETIAPLRKFCDCDSRYTDLVNPMELFEIYRGPSAHAQTSDPLANVSPLQSID